MGDRDRCRFSLSRDLDRFLLSLKMISEAGKRETTLFYGLISVILSTAIPAAWGGGSAMSGWRTPV